jgi:hypothetical protein
MAEARGDPIRLIPLTNDANPTPIEANGLPLLLLLLLKEEFNRKSCLTFCRLGAKVGIEGKEEEGTGSERVLRI